MRSLYRFVWLDRFVWLAATALLMAGVLATASPAAPPGSFRTAYVLPNSTYLINPNYPIAPGLSLRQYAYNTAVLGQAYSYVPPYALGYNPYPSYVNYGPVYPYYAPRVYYPYPAYSGYTGYYYNPYLSGYGSLYGY